MKANFLGILFGLLLFTNSTYSQCLPPSNISVANISATTATVSWNPESSATHGYDYVVISDGSIPNPATIPTGSTTTNVARFSDLWGVNGELWHPNGVLPDMTNAGFLQGNADMPDEAIWPIGENVVTGHGAVGDGIADDTQAIKNAIAACGSNRAVYFPSGTYLISEQIFIDKSNIVLRGENTQNTILKFPTGLRDAVGAGDWADVGAFINFVGNHSWFNNNGTTTHQGIENFTFDFPAIPNEGHFSNYGANAINFGSTRNGWIRDIIIKNCNNGIFLSSSGYISVINVEFDNYPGRVIPGGGDNGYAGHNGIKISGGRYNLVHNVLFRNPDEYEHNIGFNNTSIHNVISRVSGRDMQIDHHGGATSDNYFVEIDLGEGTSEVGRGTFRGGNPNSVWWNIKATSNQNYVGSAYPNNGPDPGSSSVVVGLPTCDAGDITQVGYWHETKSPDLLYPQNIYLAQLQKLNKPLPLSEVLDTPPAITNPAQINLTELIAGTSYKIYVRSNCGNCATSDWSLATSFSTSLPNNGVTFINNLPNMPVGETHEIIIDNHGGGGCMVEVNKIDESSNCNIEKWILEAGSWVFAQSLKSVSTITWVQGDKMIIRAISDAGNNACTANSGEDQIICHDFDPILPNQANKVVCVSSGTPDLILPSDPENISLTNQLTKCLGVSWTTSSDNIGVDAYQIFLNGSLITTVPHPQTTYDFTGLERNTTYVFEIQAIDFYGNLSNKASYNTNTLDLVINYSGSSAVTLGDFCANTIEIPVATPAGGVFEFISGPANYSLNPETGSFSSSVEGSFSVSYTLDKNGVCEDIKTGVIRTSEKPNPAIITGGPTRINLGTPTNFSSSTCPTGYLWSDGSDLETLSFSPSNTTNVFVFCRLNGCLSEISNVIEVKVIPDCPQVFSLRSVDDDLNGTPKSYYFKAQESIEAENKLTGISNTTYTAGKSILLKPGFKADVGTVFSAQVENCPN